MREGVRLINGVLESSIKYTLSIKSESTDLIGALSHETRRKIILLLGDNGPLTATELRYSANASIGSLYHHLAVLKEYIKQDRKRRYELTDKGWEAYTILKSNALKPKMNRFEKMIHTYFINILWRRELLSGLFSGALIGTLLYFTYFSKIPIILFMPQWMGGWDTFTAIAITIINVFSLNIITMLVFRKELADLIHLTRMCGVAYIPHIFFMYLYPTLRHKISVGGFFTLELAEVFALISSSITMLLYAFLLVRVLKIERYRALLTGMILLYLSTVIPTLL